jgi:hypothetical protein
MDILEKFLNKISYKFEKGYPDLNNPQDKLLLENELNKLGIISFSNWVMPSLSQLKQEFKVEQEMKGNEFWENEEDFLNSIKNGKIITITPSENQNIDYRRGTESYDELLDLIKSYRSYPEFRNEKTLKAIYDGFKNNQPMDLPIVIEFEDGAKRVFSGNTRMDVAFQLGINPKVLLVKSKALYENLQEGKQVGDLYHFTDINSLYSMIKDNKKIELDNDFSSFASKEYFSFTRNPKLNTLGEEKTHVRIKLDGDKLSNKYKITPYSDPEYSRTSGQPEAEERIDSSKYRGKIDLEPYIKDIYLISPSNWNEYIESLDWSPDKGSNLKNKYDHVLKYLNYSNINFDFFK